MSVPAASLRALMRRLVDYAGLFPPAALSIQEAAERYAGYLRSPEAWMLGRFVVPAERLDELAAVAQPLARAGGDAWRISAVVGHDATQGAAIRAFNAAHHGRLMVDVVECRPVEPGRVAATIGALPGELRIFVEMPLLDDPRRMLLEIRGVGAWAKIRTGGITADAFPTPRQIGRFLARAAELSVPFKATAGLHHPVCGVYPLTYEQSAPRGRMFGFLNVFAATAFAQTGANERLLTELVEDAEPSSFKFSEEMLGWRWQWVSTKQVVSARASLGLSFGSCSFEEPVGDLASLHLL